MGKTYSCTIPNCNMVFTKAYELKKHKVVHDNPDRVFYCSQCDFFTLQKKNLQIHFAIHTGKKIHHCPHMVESFGSTGSPAGEGRCEYRTNDPAALTKHRKKVHSYIPPLSRSRPSKATSPRKPRQKRNGKGSRNPRSFQHPAPVSCRRPSHVGYMTNSSNSGTEYTITSTQSPADSSLFLWQGDVDSYGQWASGYSSDVSGYVSSVSSSATLVAPDEAIGFTSLDDASLYSDWMAKYEISYSKFNETGMKHPPELLHAAPPAPPILDMQQAGREGCLCPEWMAEAGIEGWDQSVLETHRESCVLDL